jgi:curved DNA-binding protein CbpA
LDLAATGEGVDAAAVGAAYKKLALKWHPDA